MDKTVLCDLKAVNLMHYISGSLKNDQISPCSCPEGNFLPYNHIWANHNFSSLFFLRNSFSKYHRQSCHKCEKFDLECFGVFYLYYTPFFLHLQLTQQNKKWTKQYFLLIFRSIWCIILIKGWFTILKLWRGRLFYVYKFCLYRRDARGHCWYQ